MLLTAGHNLINNKGVKAKYLTVLSGNTRVGEECFKICQEYEQHPTEDYSAYDYGAVLLPKDKSKSRDGFGLNLGFSSDDDKLEGVVHVSGYRDTSDKPVTSFGDIVASGRQLKYKAPTEQGMSGSPVWAAYDGFAVAVAIQYVQLELYSRT